MGAATNIEDKIKKIAGLIGLIQAAAWIVMSIICIAIYHKNVQPPPADNSYMGQITFLIYSFFLTSTVGGLSGQKMQPHVFNGFMYSYVVLNLIWLSISATVVSRKHNTVKTVLQLWSFVTALVCTEDFIFVLLVGLDYGLCLNTAKIETDLVNQNLEYLLFLERVCANGFLTVLTIGARGFVLWIVNAVFAIVLIKMARCSKTPTQQSDFHGIEQHNFRANGIQSRYQDQFRSDEHFIQVYDQYLQSPLPMSPGPQSPHRYERIQFPYESNQQQQPFVLASPPRRF